MAGPTRYTDAGISPRTNVYAMRTMLKHQMPVVVLDKFGVVKPMPKNKTQTVTFRRPRVFTAADTPLVEGVTPTATQFRYEDVRGQIKQYGQLVEITDAIEDTAEDPVLKDASVQCGENMGRTFERLRWGVLRAGTNVFYGNGSSRASVNTVLTLSKQRAVTRALKAQKAKKFTRILSGSVNIGTRPVEASYFAVAHTDLESDIRNLAGFVSTAEYGTRAMIHETEIGGVEDVRYCLSPDLDAFPSAGASGGTNVLQADGSNADVYPILYFGMEAYGTVPLRGMDAIEPSIVPVGQRDKSDPLGQRGYVGWKSWFLTLVLHQAWMGRIEVAVTDLL